MQRITIKALESLCTRINRLTGSPEEQYSNGKVNVGNYHISCAYGGYALHRMHNESGGVIEPIGGGHMPARDLFWHMHAYIAGLTQHEGVPE